MVNYPNKMKKEKTIIKTKERNYAKANLGDNFEKKLNDSNSYYLSKEIACIYKKPTPVQIVKVDYPSRNKARISEAYYKTPSTTDYNGIYKGYHIDFEAKCCHSTSFALKNIFAHQVEHLNTVDKMGGIAFVLVEFPLHEETFLLPSKILYEKYRESLNGGRKSISYNTFKEEAYSIKTTYNPTIDYLKIVDILIEKQKNR